MTRLDLRQDRHDVRVAVLSNPLDNNAAENAIRPFVVGRMGWLFSGSPRGTKASPTLECELIERRCFHSRAEAKIAVFEFIEGWYNPHRLHSSIGYHSPID
jgi:transposase InsO family protein